MTDALFIDTYPKDKPVDWKAFIAAGPPWHGAFFKLSQGLEYEYASWAKAQRAAFLASPRYGVDLFDGFYHYFDLSEDGPAQAERFWKLVEQIGGEQAGTMWAMVDVERGGQRAIPSAKAVAENVGGFFARYRELSGIDGTLYGGELLRALGLDRMGAGRSAVALYNSVLHGKNETTEQFLARTGTDLKHTALWQYCGAITATKPEGYLVDKATGKPYPLWAPGAAGALDIYVQLSPGGIAAMAAQLAADRAASRR